MQLCLYGLLHIIEPLTYISVATIWNQYINLVVARMMRSLKKMNGLTLGQVTYRRFGAGIGGVTYRSKIDSHGNGQDDQPSAHNQDTASAAIYSGLGEPGL